MRVIRSAQASRDIIEVLAYTKERWGIIQAREYRNLVKEAIETIATDLEPISPARARRARRATSGC
jgi:plasmid stabilization system protein ParE